MIPREAHWLLLIVCTLRLPESLGERTYDTSEWIPITLHPLQASGSEAIEHQAPNERVLTLDASPKNFFPDYQQRQPNQIQPPGPKKLFDPKPRKLKFPTEYSFETPPPPQKSHIDYYDHDASYLYDQTPRVKQQRPVADRYVAVPSVNPQAPKPDAPDLYEQYQLPFNSSFYHSLSPSSINNDFYQAIRNNEANINASDRQAPRSQVEQETVQLVYVPVENLKAQPPKSEGSLRERFSLPAYSPVVSQYQATQKPFYGSLPDAQLSVSTPESKQTRLESIRQDYLQQSLGAERLQEQLADDINPLKQVYASTTAKPSLKAHQPPLAVFLESQQKAEIVDVLNILRGAKSIAVQDKVTPESPQIFIGPSNLDSPDGYTKFPLPYLNNINGNRIERKIDQLPFFVAPVGYKTPPGYAKIALPSPHVGSVVVSVPSSLEQTPHNQVLSFSSPAFEPPRTQRVPDTYDLLNPGGGDYQSNLDSFRGQYQSTLDSVRGQYQSTQSPPVSEFNGLAVSTPTHTYSPERNAFGNAYTSAPSTPYYTQPLSNQPAYQDAPNVYRPQLPEQAPAPQKPQYSARQTTQLPEVSNIDLAINEYELGQTNNHFEEHNKVKHSTTRRPEEAPRSTRRPATRTRYEETTTVRGRTRTRGRPGRTTSTTTPAAVDPDRYTVLEEFSAREVSTESYESPSSSPEGQTEPPRRPTASFSGSRYLPEEAFDTTRAQSYDNTRVELEPPKRNRFVAQEEPPSTPKQYRTEVENIPANVYSLGQPTTYGSDFEPSRTPSSSSRPFYENVEVSTTGRASSREPPTHRFGSEVVNYENREPNQGRATYSANSDELPVRPEKERESAEQRPQGLEEPSSVDNLFQPNFDQTYISLQDQAVRSLLVPNLLAPGAKQSRPTLPTESSPQPVPTTEELIQLPSSTEAPTTTTTTTTGRPTVRTRGRGRPRPTSAAAVESAPSRRTPSRRRPTPQTSSTERAVDYDSGDSGSYVQQRFRTRTRPTQNDIVERPSTTEAYQPPAIEVAYEPIKSRTAQTPYEEQLVVTIAPNPEPEIREYSRVFTAPITTTPQPVLDYENTRIRTLPVAEAPSSEQPERRLEAGPRQSEEEPYRRSHNANIQSGGVLNNRREPSTSTAPPTRVRGRTRGRSRFATTTTTPRPISRVSSRPTSATLRAPTQEQEEPEFFGFTRQPNFSPAATKLSPSTTTLEPAVRFVGEIRPKYTPRTTTGQPAEDVDYAETPRTRVRARTRAPARPTPANTVRPVESEPAAGRGRVATPQRTRGRSHYRAPENVKRENEDEDVANQNYPTEFLQKLEVSSAKPRKTFQITVDPLEGDDDQASYSSIHRPKFVQAPLDSDGSTASTQTRDPNGLQFSEKPQHFPSPEPQALAFELSDQPIPVEASTWEESQETASTAVAEPTTKSRRRGAWKLVRQRPADPLEVSESQNYQSVLNAFESIGKSDSFGKTQHFKDQSSLEDVRDSADEESLESADEESLESAAASTEPKLDELSPTTKTPENFFEKIYEMFGVFGHGETNATTVSSASEDSSTVANPVFPEEITELPTTTSGEEQKAAETTETLPASTTLNISASSQPYDVEPWEMKQVKTSTSTEVSHETEICYKGRCVKSRDKKTHK
ncbi:mucin-5AC [Dendroctonus ponderosae]|uniref:mucin-5AC n=1 Tax=Dendroctonus ponderosae TaxID=77166 RepID=UPI0020361814|nr:mucin-5AC [Dendroctonus ponderosae]